MKRVKITIGKNGEVTTEAFGFEGSSCERATEFLNKIFGSPNDKELKPEYYTETGSDTLVEGLPGCGYCG